MKGAISHVCVDLLHKAQVPEWCRLYFMCVCVCACVRVGGCVRMCVRACIRVCMYKVEVLQICELLKVIIALLLDGLLTNCIFSFRLSYHHFYKKIQRGHQCLHHLHMCTPDMPSTKLDSHQALVDTGYMPF